MLYSIEALSVKCEVAQSVQYSDSDACGYTSYYAYFLKKLIREDCFAPLLAFIGDGFSCMLFRGSSASLSLVMIVVADGVSSSLALSQTFSVTDNRMKKY